jgi:hypothetical protein
MDFNMNKVTHLKRDFLFKKSTLLVQQEKLEILILNHLQSFYPDQYEQEPMKIQINKTFNFWSNRGQKNKSNSKLLQTIDKANLITRSYSNWMVNRFDETDLTFFTSSIRILSSKQFIEEFLLALQGLPNQLFEIKWNMYSSENSSLVESQVLEVNLDMSMLPLDVQNYLLNDLVRPVCSVKLVKIENYTTLFTSNLLEKMKSHVEKLLVIFQLNSKETNFLNQYDYFEASLLQKIKELMVSFYSFRIISFRKNHLSEFLAQFDQFYVEMIEVFRFISLSKLSDLGLLDLCYAIKTSITEDSSLFRWIER